MSIVLRKEMPKERIITRLFGNTKHDRKAEILVSQIEALQEQWRKEKTHRDALKQREQNEAEEKRVRSFPTQKGLIELLKMLKKQEMNDNCDTTHRIYLTGEQWDNEAFEVKNKYRFCPDCGRFYNKELLDKCYCSYDLQQILELQKQMGEQEQS